MNRISDLYICNSLDDLTSEIRLLRLALEKSLPQYLRQAEEEEHGPQRLA